MTHKKQAIVLSYVYSSLLIKNLEVAVHEARVSKDPDVKKMADKLKKLQDQTITTMIFLNKKMIKDGVDMNTVEEELDTIMDEGWVNIETNEESTIS